MGSFSVFWKLLYCFTKNNMYILHVEKSNNSQSVKNKNIIQIPLVLMLLLSHAWLFASPWTVAHQAPLSMEFSRQEYCSRVPFPSPGDLPDPGLEPLSPASPALAVRFFTTQSPGKPFKYFYLETITANVLRNRLTEISLFTYMIFYEWTYAMCTHS